MIVALSVILFFLLLITGRSRCVKSFVTLYLNILIIIFYIFLMDKGINAIFLAVALSVAASAIIIFLLNGSSTKTKTAFISVLIVLGISAGLTIAVTSFANMQGFAEDKIEAVGGFNYDINYSMAELIAGIFIVGIVGTVTDTAMSISSALNEVHENNLQLSREELHRSGMNIGRDILSTTINTLFFALVLGIIGFFIWHKNADPGFLINYKSLTQSAVNLLLCFISSILIIPITSYITADRLSKTRTVYRARHRR